MRVPSFLKKQFPLHWRDVGIHIFLHRFATSRAKAKKKGREQVSVLAGTRTGVSVTAKSPEIIGMIEKRAANLTAGPIPLECRRCAYLTMEIRSPDIPGELSIPVPERVADIYVQ